LDKEFRHIIPDSESFHRHLHYTFPSIDEMYENEEFDKYKNLFGGDDDENDMHYEFVSLMIDTFNIHNEDSYLQQLVISLICRYHSERADFIRNLDRMMLFYDKDDWNYYTWTQRKLNEFVVYSEKANIWMSKIQETMATEEMKVDSLSEENEITKLHTLLTEIKRVVVYKSRLVYDEDHNEYEVKFNKTGGRKINEFIQDLYRNLKVYDYMINFLFQNESLFITARQIDLEQKSEEERKIIEAINKVFRKIFSVLRVMTANNDKTKELMWKYKEKFVFKKLGKIPESGELELVLNIIDDSKAIAKSRNLRSFVNALNMRIGSDENFVLLLEIYNKLINYESMSFVK
jgi:hypothetical protein